MNERTRTLGSVTLHLVSDGLCRMDGGAVFGIVPKPVWQRLAQVDERNRVPMELNCLLVDTGKQRILVDTGFGPKLSPKLRDIYATPESQLLANLAALGLRPSDIGVVINTHLHTDHSGGNTYLKGAEPVPTFPNAAYIVQEQEWHDATHPNERTHGVYLAENLLPVHEAGQLRLVSGDAFVTEGVRCLFTPGHTRGHQAVAIESDGQTAIFLGDLAPWALFLEKTGWSTAFDVEPLHTLESKKALCRLALATDALLIFEHDPTLFWGRLEEAEGGLRIVVA